MTVKMKNCSGKHWLLLAALLLSAAPAAAQGVAVATQQQVTQLDRRVNALEGQMRAVQRQVFPGGDKRFFAPEPAPADTAAMPGTAATAPLADLTQRVDALEQNQRTLTGQIEQLQFQLRQLQEEMGKTRGDVEFRLNALEGNPSAPTATSSTPPTIVTPPPGPATAVAPTGTPAPAPAPATATATPPAAAPASGLEAGEAAYRAAYALYTTGNDAGAVSAFEAFLKQYPDHARASHAHFWAGRALMRQKQPAPAAKLFLDGYKKHPRGERAHNSLLWLGNALIEMKQLQPACQVLDELRSVYPDRLTGAVLKDANAARATAKCGA